MHGFREIRTFKPPTDPVSDLLTVAKIRTIEGWFFEF